MKSAKIDSNNIVVNIAVGIADGYVECPDNVAIDWLYDGSVFTAPVVVIAPPTEEEQLVTLKAEYLMARHAPIDVGGNVFQVNGDSEGYTKLKESSATPENFAIAVSIAESKGRETNGSTTIPWTLLDNTDLDMDRDEILVVVTAIGVRGAELHYDYQDDKAAILAQ